MTKNTLLDPRIYGELGAMSRTPMPGHELIDLKGLGLVLPQGGGARGYNASADVLTRTTDGRELNDIWAEFQATLELQNEARQTLIDLLTFSVTETIEDVPQFGGGDFEEMSEYGVPQGIRPTSSVLSLGYTFKWYDLAARFTWQFLAEASASQVEAVNAAALDADNRLVFREVMRTLFRNTNRTANIRGQNFNVYTFWNGDGNVPPPYKAQTFDGSYTHFRTTGTATVGPADLEEISDALKSHGYSAENGTQQILMVNAQEARVIRAFRANTGGALYDFIPATGQPGLILGQESVLNGQPGDNYRGLTVIGSYGEMLIIEESYIPAGYMVALASGGRANLNNPIGIREHQNAGLRGLRLVKGRDNDYPLIDSYYVRGFGTGVRQRGAGLVMQVTTNASYSVPAQYA